MVEEYNCSQAYHQSSFSSEAEANEAGRVGLPASTRLQQWRLQLRGCQSSVDFSAIGVYLPFDQPIELVLMGQVPE